MIFNIQLPFGPSPPPCLDEGILRLNDQRTAARWKDIVLTSGTT